LYNKAGASAELVLIQKAPHAFWNYMPWFEETMNRAGTFLHRVANQRSESQFSGSDFQKCAGLREVGAAPMANKMPSTNVIISLTSRVLASL
jgi:hypothetical protein